MNNSTRNFTNSSNAQNSSSFKDKLRKLTTGVALAGTLLMGTACENKTSTAADQQKEKIENVEVKADNQDSELNDIDFDKAAAELDYEFRDMQIKADSIANLEDAKRIEEKRNQLIIDNKGLDQNIKQIWIETEKELSTVTQEDIRKSEVLQKELIEYIERCKRNGQQPGQHVQSLMASIKK